MKPKKIHAEMPVKATPEEMWKVLSQFGDVSTFHAGVAESHNAEGSDNKASLGCERVCNIVDMGIPITLKERIIDYDEGRSYQFEVYEWKNFPLQEMRFRFTIREITPPDTMLALPFPQKIVRDF